MTTRDRLLRHALQLAEEEPDNVTLDAVAARAGLSRATAYRHFSGSDDLRIQVALARGAELLASSQEVMATKSTAAAQLEELFVLVVREVTKDRQLLWLFEHGATRLEDPTVSHFANDAIHELVTDAQRSGEWRAEPSPDAVVRWLVEQLAVAVGAGRHSESDVRERVRMFVVPSLAAAEAPSDIRSIARNLHVYARRLSELG